jgi:tetratricopeptide (TPR) repeat protein
MELYNPCILAASIAALIISGFIVLNRKSNKKREDIDKCKKLYNNGLYTKTIEYCKSLTEKDKNPLIYYYLGLAYAEIDEVDLAIENFEKAEELSKNKLENYFNPYVINYPVFYEDYGDALKSTKRFDEAILYYKKALKEREKEKSTEGIIKLLQKIAELYKIKGNLDEAIDCYEDLKEREKEKSTEGIIKLLQKIAELYEIKGNLDEAIDCYEEVLIHLNVSKESTAYKNLIRKIANLYERKGNIKIANKMRKKIGEEITIEEIEEKEEKEKGKEKEIKEKQTSTAIKSNPII